MLSRDHGQSCFYINGNSRNRERRALYGTHFKTSKIAKHKRFKFLVAERRHLVARGFNPGLDADVVTSPGGTAPVLNRPVNVVPPGLGLGRLKTPRTEVRGY